MNTSNAKKGISKFYWLKNPYPQFEERSNVILNAGFEFVMSVFLFSQKFQKSHQVNKMYIYDQKMHICNAKKGIPNLCWLKNPYPQFEERIYVISNAGCEFVMSIFLFSQICRKSHQVNKMCISDRKMRVSDVRTLH